MQGACYGARELFLRFRLSSSIVSVDAPTPLVQDVAGHYRAEAEVEVLSVAQTLLWAQVAGRSVLSSRAAVKDYLMVRMHRLDHEVFARRRRPRLALPSPWSHQRGPARSTAERADQ